MKKLVFSLLLALPFCDAFAQYKLQYSAVEAPVSVPVIRSRGSYVPTPLYDDAVGAKSASAVLPRWYNHAQALASYYGLSQAQLYSDRYTTALAIWQDSSVRYTGTSSNLGITWLSAAEMFAPNTNLYNSNTTTPVNNRGKMQVKNESYRVDSVMIRGFYNRVPGQTYDDSLILTFVSDSTLGTYSWYSYSGSTLANHGLDSFGALLWRGSDYLTAPINQISYSVTPTSGPVKYVRYRGQIRLGLTNALYIDSLSDGSQIIKVPVGLTVPGTSSTTGPGGRISMSITFKSGTTYTPGTPITNYGYWALMSHETDSAQFQQYPPTDVNMSYLVSKDSVNTYVGNGLNIYIPTIGFTSPVFSAEVHDISWKISCTTCGNVSVPNLPENVTVGRAYPNPASSTLNVPLSVKTASEVTVTLSNLVGQVLKTQTYHIGSGQSKTAMFSTSDLSNGIYICTVESEGGRIANRVVVAH